MAIKTVQDSSLTSIANAIRGRGGTSAQLQFPNGFVSAVNDIPNTYAQADEGKVVSSGALVGQTSRNVTANGTVDTTLNNEVVVAVPNPSSGTLSITQNGIYDVTEKASVDVSVNPPYWCIGKNPTLLRTDLKPKVYLKDTNYATWTPSTTATLIVPTTAEFTFEADMPNYDYMLCTQFYTHLYYDDGAQQKGMFIEGSGESWTAVYRFPNGVTQFFDRNWNANGASLATQTINSTHYYTANGSESIANSLIYGIYFSTQLPTVSSTTTSNPTWTVKSPSILARCHDSYFSNYNAGHVNQNTSYYQLKYILYRVDYGTCPYRFAQDRKNDILINNGIE